MNRREFVTTTVRNGLRKYEQAVNPAPDPSTWFPASIAVSASNLNVFVNGAKDPCLAVGLTITAAG